MLTDRNKNRFKRYTEAGLAVLIVLTLGLAGATGALSPRAAESGQTESAAGAEKNSKDTGSSFGSSQDAAESEDAEASGNDRERAVSDHGEAAILQFRRWSIILMHQERYIRQKSCLRAARIPLRHSLSDVL